MMKPDTQNKAFFWATVFLRELHAHGVRHLVISPGSRSTPLVMAGASHPGFKRHVVVDERSAAFIALGIGKVTGNPAALICTSGTAAANYFPAVIESRQSGVPLIVLTADRPPKLRNIGASQAIDQLKLFGGYPLFFHEAGEPSFEKGDLERLQQAAGQGCHLSMQRQGPVHFNFPFRKPLEPEPGYVSEISKENKKSEKIRTPKTAVVTLQEETSLAGEVREMIQRAARPVVITGPQGIHPYRAAEQLAERLDAPLLSQFPETETGRTITGFEGFLRQESIYSDLAPDLIVRFGRQPVGKALQLYLQEHDKVPHIHFADLEEWHDSTHTVTHRVEWFGKKIEWELEKRNGEPDWFQRWQTASSAFVERRNDLLRQESKLTDGHVFSRLSRKFPRSWNLFLSNSFPVRDWMLFGDGTPGPTFVNRGASGIDGVISSAVGTTLESGRPGILFIGDLATLHDSNALLSGRLMEHPLVVVILNNGGGTIFRMLPIREHSRFYTEFFETPQQARFRELAKMHGIGYHRVTTVDGLIKCDLEQISSTPGIHLLECRTDADRSMKLRRRLWNSSGGDEG